VDIWTAEQLSRVVGIYNGFHIKDVLAAVTLVDFPGFRDLHDAIFLSFEVFRISAYSGSGPYSFDAQEWELYVKYRQLLSEFLTNRQRSGALFVGAVHYLKLAQYFSRLLMGEMSYLVPGRE
jgi:hypothetical protein